MDILHPQFARMMLNKANKFVVCHWCQSNQEWHPYSIGYSFKTKEEAKQEMKKLIKEWPNNLFHILLTD